LDAPLQVVTEQKPASPARLPEPAQAQLRQVLSAMQTGDEAQAMPLLQGLVEAYPGLLSPWLNLGILRLRTGQLESADAALQQALRLDPENPVAQHQRAIVLRHQGRFKEALALYQALLAAHPDHALGHRNLGILYDLYLNQPQQALAHYRRYAAFSVDGQAESRVWIAELQRRIAAEGR
jgi:tetratricopeptide (TPR) repeat protein